MIYTPNYVCTFDFVPHKINGVFEADHMTKFSYIYIYTRLPITHSLTYRLPETAWFCQLVTHSSIHVTCVHIYSATFFFHVLPFWLDLFQSWAWPQTFSSNLERVKRPAWEKTLEYIAIVLCIDTSCEILSQHTFIVYRILLIFSPSP